MRLLRNWFRPKDQIRPVSFSRKYEIASFSAKYFSLGLLQLSAGTYEATSSTAANVVSSGGSRKFWWGGMIKFMSTNCE